MPLSEIVAKNLPKIRRIGLMTKKLISALLALFIMLSTAAPALATDGISGMTISDAGLKFIEEYEGFSPYVYSDSSNYYIGYGTRCNPDDYPNGITREEAEELLREELKTAEAKVKEMFASSATVITQNRFDALVSFTYNLGYGWMNPSEELYNYIKSGNFTEMDIVNAFGIWCHQGGRPNQKLIERRLGEAAIFFYADYSTGESARYNYLIFNPGAGTIDRDIAFYKSGEPYGTLPKAKLKGYTFNGWFSPDYIMITNSSIATKNLTVTAGWVPGEEPEVISYKDVKETDWFYTYVTDLSSKGIVNGYPEGVFKPSSPLTCGEALKLILLATGYGEQKPTNSHWASGYLDTAVKKGIVKSGEITNLDAPITRLMVAHITAKALSFLESDIKSPFADTDDGYVLTLYRQGIVEGSSDTGVRLFKPNDNINRAEVSTIVWRLCNTDIYKNMIHTSGYWVNILEGVPVHTRAPDRYYLDNGIMKYDSNRIETYAGVDVSSHQYDIDWSKVKAAGINFAIIRVGYRGYETGKVCLDDYFEKNIKGALENGIKVGVYFFSQAISPEEAVEEAEFVLKQIEGYDITYPVVFDWEPFSYTTARTYGLDNETLNKCAVAFLERVKAAGYKPMVYFNNYLGYLKYDLRQLVNYDFWYANYSAMPSMYYDFDIWQYTSTGRVDGIATNVDMNICFKKY